MAYSLPCILQYYLIAVFWLCLINTANISQLSVLTYITIPPTSITNVDSAFSIVSLKYSKTLLEAKYKVWCFETYGRQNLKQTDRDYWRLLFFTPSSSGNKILIETIWEIHLANPSLLQGSRASTMIPVPHFFPSGILQLHHCCFL